MDLINNVYATDRNSDVRWKRPAQFLDEQKKAEMLSAKVKPKMDEMRRQQITQNVDV